MAKLLPWWTGFAQSAWQPADWRRWEREGRPRLPRDVRLQPGVDLSAAAPVVQAPRPMGAFPLYGREESRAQARRRRVDALLAKHGIVPRPRARR